MQKLDFILIVFVFVTMNLYAVLYAFINKNIEEQMMTEERRIFEFKQY